MRPWARVPKKGLRAQLDTLAGRGLHIFAGLHMLALGMEMNE
jgi:8-amino-7-oxononanoate synthase